MYLSFVLGLAFLDHHFSLNTLEAATAATLCTSCHCAIEMSQEIRRSKRRTSAASAFLGLVVVSLAKPKGVTCFSVILPYQSTSCSYHAATAALYSSRSSSSDNKVDNNSGRNVPLDYEVPFYPVPRKIDEALLGDLTGGRPGAIIETEEQLATKELIQNEIDGGLREYPDFFTDYGESILDEEDAYDIDDPDALDAATLGTWTIADIRARFKYEWDPLSGEPDPNLAPLQQDGVRYLAETEKNDDGVEVGYDPIFGPSNPMDTRTILGAIDSYMIDEKTRDTTMLAPLFPQPNDVEIQYNEDVVQFRKSLDILETYVDPFLPDFLPIPRRVATWYGYPEPVYLKPQNFTNNRFTAEENRTDFESMTPYEARRKAVELARSKNAEWLPSAVSHAWHQQQRAPYERYETLVGTLRPGECDPELVDLIQPALQILGSCCQLLSIESTAMISDTNVATTVAAKDDSKSSSLATVPALTTKTVYRFAYHGLMKNRHGMACWTKTLLEDCGVPVTGVVMESGFRRRDPAYDGGDAWYAPLF
jgi:hypothetical protein